MILSDISIHKALAEGRIVIDPLMDGGVQPGPSPVPGASADGVGRQPARHRLGEGDDAGLPLEQFFEGHGHEHGRDGRSPMAV